MSTHQDTVKVVYIFMCFKKTYSLEQSLSLLFSVQAPTIKQSILMVPRQRHQDFYVAKQSHVLFSEITQ